MVLTDSEQVLSLQHRWTLPGGGRGAEDACYVNALRPGSFNLAPERVERLAQGRMIVADVCCAGCGRCVGWKFVSSARQNLDEGSDDDDGDCDRRQRANRANVNQVGRFGLVMSAFRLEGEPEPEDEEEEDDEDEDEDEEAGSGLAAMAAMAVGAAHHHQHYPGSSSDDDHDGYGHMQSSSDSASEAGTPPWASPPTILQPPHANLHQHQQLPPLDEDNGESDISPAARRDRAGRCRQA